MRSLTGRTVAVERAVVDEAMRQMNGLAQATSSVIETRTRGLLHTAPMTEAQSIGRALADATGTLIRGTFNAGSILFSSSKEAARACVQKRFGEEVCSGVTSVYEYDCAVK